MWAPGPSPKVPLARIPEVSPTTSRARAGARSTLFVCSAPVPPPPVFWLRLPRPALPGHAQPMRRGGGAQAPGRCPRLLRPLAALRAPPQGRQQPQGSRRTARSEGPLAAGGLLRGVGIRPGRNLRPVRNRSLSRRRTPPPRVCPGLRARRRQPDRTPAQPAGWLPTATSPAKGRRRRRTWRKDGQPCNGARLPGWMRGG